jgi:hypothetical protein
MCLDCCKELLELSLLFAESFQDLYENEFFGAFGNQGFHLDYPLYDTESLFNKALLPTEGYFLRNQDEYFDIEDQKLKQSLIALIDTDKPNPLARLRAIFKMIEDVVYSALFEDYLEHKKKMTRDRVECYIENIPSGRNGRFREKKFKYLMKRAYRFM